MKAVTTLWVVSMFLATFALGDDVDDVKAAVQRYTDSVNAGDAEAYVRHYLAGYTFFNFDGGLFGRAGSLEEEKRNFQAVVDSGLKRNLQIRHLEVQVHGNAAVTAYYLVGTRTLPDGTIERINSRRTAVWIKQGSSWKQFHRHNSPIRLPQ